MMTSPVSVSIQSPDEQAFSAIVDHHAALGAELGRLAADLRAVVTAGAAHEPALTALREFVTGSVLPHAAAEEAVLYPAAAASTPTRLLVEAMVMEHRALTGLAGALAGPGSDVDALAAAEGIVAVFAVHVRKENEFLLPALSRQPGISLAALLRSMEGQVASAGGEREGEREGEASPASPPAGEQPAELDVRTLPHGAGRHEVIFARLGELAVAGRLVIINDHDPRPLRFQIEAAWPGAFGWEYLQAGPEIWRVGITRRM